jgi:stage II sporulation protein AA (anti-sigma F factor antagonist)
MSDVQINVSPLEGAPEGVKAYTVSIQGQLDETNVDEQSKVIYDLLEKEGANISIVLDLSGLTYMNSKSIGYLTDWYTKVNEAGGKLVLSGAQDNVLDVLTVVGITNLIQHYPSTDEAKHAIFS